MIAEFGQVSLILALILAILLATLPLIGAHRNNQALMNLAPSLVIGPMWGTWWAWDARLTSMLVLLFIYLGIMGLYAAFEDRRKGARVACILVLVGLVNIPIIHFSVEWWTTLHQGATIRFFGESTMHPSMLPPLVWMTIAVKLMFAAALLDRSRNELLEQDRRKGWVREMIGAAR